MARNIDITVPDLSGRLAVVTGASDGIGTVIATRLAEAGAEVIIPVRNPAKGEQAVDHIRGLVPGARITTRTLDLASLDSVAALSDQLLAEGRPINLLVNNAGVMRPPARPPRTDSSCSSAPTISATSVTHQTSIAARRGAIN